MAQPFNRLDYIYKLFVIIALSIAGLMLASDIVIPLLIAGFLSIVLLPLVKRLEKKLSLTLAASVVLIITFVVFGGGMWIIGAQLANLVQDLPDLQSRFDTFINQLSDHIEFSWGIKAKDQVQLLKDGLSTASTYVTNIVVETTNTLSLLIQIPVYIFLFLIYRQKFKDFFTSLLPADEASSWKQGVQEVLQGYISGLLWVTLIIAALNTIGLLLLGIEHAIFFGVLSGILTIIPYVGIFIGATLPALMALLTKDSIWYTVGVIAIFSVVQFLEGNFITPRITGSKVSVNALAAIIALLIGGKILGIAGMILAVPIVGVLRVLLAHTQHLKPFVILLEDDAKQKSESTAESSTIEGS
jgi:predicted PurR-regulated permease PerM